MQKSRRSSIQGSRRRLFEGMGWSTCFHKVTLSVAVVVLWSLILLLLNLWIGTGGLLLTSKPAHFSANSTQILASTWLDHEYVVAEAAATNSTYVAPNLETETSTINRFSGGTRVPVPDLDEFKKNQAIHMTSQAGGGRVDPGDEASHNHYASSSSSKGAEVLSYNKEAKGAANILNTDKDKYLLNPCSAEEKFVVIELTEETLVDTIRIANFEHHSSNLKDFELFGSPDYPDDDESWVKLGSFDAANAKRAQDFVVAEPKWVRYLKLNMISHHGSEFYCTLSAVEVYGVGAIEKMFEELVAEVSVVSSEEAVNRMPTESAVLKMIMEKVISMGSNVAVFEQYLEKWSSRYNSIFKEFDKEIGDQDVLLEKFVSDVESLSQSKEKKDKGLGDLKAWKLRVSMQMENLLRENEVLRLRMERRRLNIENTGIANLRFFSYIFVFCILCSRKS